ncbi:MAG: hypothetical protein ABIE70_00480 [bacterium]
MRKLVLLVCIAAILQSGPGVTTAYSGMIPSWEASSGKLGFWPISNEVSVYHNIDDAGDDRGQTLQIVSINSFRLLTSFNFEFTADYNFDLTPGLNRDHYIELSLVKPVTPLLSVNVQRVISTFEEQSINQLGFRLVF